MFLPKERLMIESEKQRHWWFANHPEYSNSYKGKRQKQDNEGDGGEEKVSPESVDAYVDEALNYVNGTVAALLKSFKRNFGTQAELSRKQQENLEAWEKVFDRGWGTPAGTYDEGALFISEVPRMMPTREELSRWPRQMVRRIFQWIEAISQSNPVLMDRDALERHHQLVKKHAEYFMECGLSIEEYVVILKAGDHRLKGEDGQPGGLHTGKGRGGDWNREWDEFVKEWPKPDDSREHKGRIRNKLEDMKKRYRIDEKAILSPGTSGSD
jgi:hypothetical protein